MKISSKWHRKEYGRTAIISLIIGSVLILVGSIVIWTTIPNSLQEHIGLSCCIYGIVAIVITGTMIVVDGHEKKLARKL